MDENEEPQGCTLTIANLMLRIGFLAMLLAVPWGFVFGYREYSGHRDY